MFSETVIVLVFSVFPSFHCVNIYPLLALAVIVVVVPLINVPPPVTDPPSVGSAFTVIVDEPVTAPSVPNTVRCAPQS